MHLVRVPAVDQRIGDAPGDSAGRMRRPDPDERRGPRLVLPELPRHSGHFQGQGAQPSRAGKKKMNFRLERQKLNKADSRRLVLHMSSEVDWSDEFDRR